MKVFNSIDLDIREVADFIEENGLSFVCNDKMKVEATEDDFEILIEKFPHLDYTEETMEDIADEEGLELVETTSERNGYPSHLKYALVGFKNFDEAKRVAAEHYLRLAWIDKRDGWQLWHRGDTAYEPMTISSSDYGDDYHFENDKSSVMEFAYDVLEDMVYKEASFDDIRNYMDEVEKITDAIENLEDNQVVVTYCGNYYDTIDVHPIYFYHDTEHTQLAAVKY